MSDKKLRKNSIPIHGGQSVEPVTGAVMPPVFQTSTYAQPWPAKHTGYEYSRSQNPTREALERGLAELEGGTHGMAFGSGLAATSTMMLTLPEGAKVVCGDDVYGGTYRLFTKVFAQRSMSFSFEDMSATAPEVAIPEGTDLVWLESPTNPLLKVADIRAYAARCKEVGAILVVDNTFATPYFQRPLELGADVVMHSTTKYINGHSDVVGGALVTANDELAEKIRFMQNSVGGVNGPWDAWLTLRGIKTLGVRMERHFENAKIIAKWLVEHPEVTRVYFPWLESDPNYAVASKQMTGFSGMISFVIEGDLYRAEKFCASTQVITLAESLGGVESLIELPATMTHASIPPDVRAAAGIDDGLVRLSVGIEDVQDLIDDLQHAFDASRP